MSEPPRAKQKAAQKIDVPVGLSADESLHALREWMAANKIPVSVDASAGETVEAVSATLLKTSKAMRAMKKNGDDLKRELEEFMARKVAHDEAEIDDRRVMVDLEKQIASNAQIISENEELKQKINALEEDFSRRGEDEQALVSRLAELEGELGDARGVSEEHMSAQARIDELTAELESLRDTSACPPGVASAADMSRSLAEAEKTKSSLREDYDLLRDEYDKLVRSVTTKEAYDKQSEELLLAQEEIEKLSEELAAATKQVESLQGKVESSKEAVDELGKCQSKLRTMKEQHEKVQADLDALLTQYNEKVLALAATEASTENECDCTDTCLAQSAKLRSNLQKQADALRQRTFDAEVKLDEQKDRCDEIDRQHGETKRLLREQTELTEATKETLDEERQLREKKCPKPIECPEPETCPKCEESASTAAPSEEDSLQHEKAMNVESTEQTSSDAESTAVVEDPTTDEVEVDTKVDDTPVMDTTTDESVFDTSNDEEQVTEELGEQPQIEEPVTVEETKEVADDEISVPEGSMDETAATDSSIDEQMIDTGLIQDLDWNEEDAKITHEQESKSSQFYDTRGNPSGFDMIRSSFGRAWTFVSPFVMFIINFVTRVMEGILHQAWKTKHGNKLLSFMELCDETFTSVAVKVDSIMGTALASNKDLITFGVNATIFGPPIVLTLILMRVVSVLLGGGAKNSGTQGKWKGPPPRSAAPLSHPNQPDSPRRRDVPPLQHADAATHYNTGNALAPPVMMAPPMGAGPTGIPSPVESPRANGVSQYAPTFGNPYASMSNPPPHMADLPTQVPHAGEPFGTHQSGVTNGIPRSMSLTDHGGQSMEEMANDTPDSEAAATNAPFVMMGNPATNKPIVPQWQRAPPAAAPPQLSAPPSAPPMSNALAPNMSGGRGRGPPPGRGYPGRGPPPGRGRGRGPPGRGPPPGSRGPPPPFAPRPPQDSHEV
ncbi:predicted protein [Ostreococcus lucimarinus CCE9901]|uniref:Uncharacterized protein n=1 Tax=Ostreococcus lucimarinus (strain CCE9901) TaxID=436017 RepID=A4RXC9_OSTLU|nr:predicted protein [Ostreococcus lucimarinus CCE9901]ABO96271.1 predicted protein [Ostreococcus lucimarinus CCE9901]|eukprot:XP_001417978.1 predicted protein [Ostreococcus lucimarinus CCE9901]